jgi:hypothetical protein
MGLDEAAAEMAAEGIPIEDGGHLYSILIAEDTPALSAYDRIYQEGWDARKATDRAERMRKRQREKDARVKALLGRQDFRAEKEAMTAAARHMIGAKNAGEAASPRPYIRERDKHRRLADKALRAGDSEAFNSHKRLEVLNSIAAREALKAGKEEDAAINFLRKYANRAAKEAFGVAPPYLAQIDAMLERFDLRRRTPGPGEGDGAPLPDLGKFAEDMKARGEVILIPDKILNANFRKHWSKLTLDELRDLRDAAKSLEHAGRFQNRLFKSERNRNADQAVAEMVKKIEAYYKVKGSPAFKWDTETRSKARKLIDGAASFAESLETAEFICRALDGYEDMGPAYSYIFLPVRNAVAEETLKLNETFAKVRDLTVRVFGTDTLKMKAETIDVSDTGIAETDTDGRPTGKPMASMRRDTFTAFLLNCGNAGNWQRTRDGWFQHVIGNSREETVAMRDGLMRRLMDKATKQDWDFVQGLWDVAESLRPMVGETHEIMTGVSPRWVDAVPVSTKFGTYRGGYWPIVTDTRYSERAAVREEVREHMAAIDFDYLAGSTRADHRKARADSVPGRPPLLSLGVVDRHLVTVVHDAVFAPVIRDANMLIRRKAFRDAVELALGDGKNQTLNHWLRAVAANNKNNGLAKDWTDRFLNGAKTGVTMMGLGANFAGAFMQTLGYFPLAGKIGPLRAVRAILRYVASPRRTHDFVLSKSAFMREQMGGQDRDVRDITRKWSAEGGGKIDALRGAMLWQYSFFQNLCNIPGWMEAYSLGMEKFSLDEKKAIGYADMVIRTTQGAGSIADLTAFETSGEWKKMFTMFYSWFRVRHNMMVEAGRRIRHEPGAPRKLGIALNFALAAVILPALAERLIREGGPDDDEKWAQWLVRHSAWAAITAPAAGVPFARDIAPVAENAWNREARAGGGYRFTPLASAFESSARLFGAAAGAIHDGMEDGWGEADFGAVMKPALDFSGYAFALPVRQARNALEEAAGVWEGTGSAEEAAYRLLLGRRRQNR